MLQSLRVKNLAIVENIQVEFGAGLNIITGETGAGKSILVGALGLLLGERADKDMIRAGEEQCSVEASFQMADSDDVDAVLEEFGLEPCEGGRLIVRRILSAAGSRNFLNDSSATLQVLKKVGDLLVDMHGPHDHQSLLNPEYQIDLLDAFGNLWKSRAAYEEAYRRMRGLMTERDKLQQTDQQGVAQQVEMLSFQVKEIEEAQLNEDDEENLAKEHTRVANAQRILELAGQIRAALSDDEHSAFNRVVAARRLLGELAGVMPEAAEWQKEAESAAGQIQAMAQSLGSAVDRIDCDPARLQWLDDRLTLLHKLKRKYGGSVKEILEFLQRSRQRLRELETRGEQLARIEADLAAARKQVESAGATLGVERRAAAEKLGEDVSRELHDLGFQHGVVDIALEPGEPGPSGLDRIEFAFAPNPGEPRLSLRAIASSGEISRVMLATKAVLATHDRIPVLVFDEIDANVGGEMGLAIGEKLEKVAKHHQVLCITHLPQVAVHGTTHFAVEKRVRGERTYTGIKLLDENARTDEVARMLGGRTPTQLTRDHAREMLATVGKRRT